MANQNDTFEVKNEEAQKALREVGEYIKGMVPAGYGFTLLLFNMGEGGAMFYMSSAERESMIEAMKEFIKNNETKK